MIKTTFHLQNGTQDCSETVFHLQKSIKNGSEAIVLLQTVECYKQH